MLPTVSRAEINNSDDVIAEPHLVPVRRHRANVVGSPKAQCEGKKAFDGRELANIAAKRIAGRVAYRCQYCRKWHVGGKLDR
jgi:hypothetical protein